MRGKGLKNEAISMRRLGQLALSIGVLISWTVAVHAGSIYSSRGIGTRSFNLGARSLGMGGVCLAFLDSRDLNRLNPAALSQLDLVHLSADFVTEYLNTRSLDRSFATQYATFGGAMVGIPLHSNISMAGGLYPLTRVDFEVTSQQSLGGFSYRKSVESKGGLSQAFFYLSWKLLRDRLYLGGGARLILGVIEESWRVDYEDPSFIDSYDRFKKEVLGGDFIAGFIVKALPFWSIGGMYATSSNLDVNLEALLVRGRVRESGSERLNLPRAWGLGTAFWIGKRLLCAADFYTEQWSRSQFGGSLDLPLYDYRRYSVGLEWTPPPNASGPYYRRLFYRVGLCYETPYYPGFENERLTQYFLSFGLGLPFAGNRGRWDVALIIGKRGSLPRNVFTENIFRLVISVTGGERWFVRGTYR